MGEYDIATPLMQVEPGGGGVFLANLMRGEIRRTLFRVMEAEIALLCGAIHHPAATSDCFRAGSAPGWVLNEGRTLKVNRPRVRLKANGKSEEVRLASYEAARRAGARDNGLRTLTMQTRCHEQRAAQKQGFASGIEAKA